MLVVDSLLTPNVNSGLLRRAAMLAKRLDRSFTAAREKAENEIRMENVKRTDTRERKPEMVKKVENGGSGGA